MFFSGLPFKKGLAELRNPVEFYGYRIPPLISSYVKLSDEMMVFDSAINTGFGGVPDTAILYEISKMHADKRARIFPGDYKEQRVA